MSMPGKERDKRPFLSVFLFFPPFTFFPIVIFGNVFGYASATLNLPLHPDLPPRLAVARLRALVIVEFARTHARAFVIECRCRFIFYCGKDCQKRDWKLHKNECLRIGNMDPSLVPKLVNQFTRLVARAIDLDQMGESQKESNFYKVDGELGI